MTPLIVFIFAFLVRLINLNQSLWLDETIVAKVVKTIPFFQIPIQFSPGDFHPPLYYLFISLWSSLFGMSEFALRLPSVIYSLIAGWFIYKIGLELKGKSFGLWSAAFFLFNPLIIYYSQEARMYLMATMFLTGALHYFLLTIKEIQTPSFAKASKGKPNYFIMSVLLFNIFSALAMFTFYGSAFFIATMILIYFVISTKRSARRDLSMTLSMTIGVIVATALLSPLLIQQMSNAKSSLVDVKNWSLVLGKAEFKNVFMIFMKFTSGRLSWFPKWSYYLVAGGWSVLVGLALLLGINKHKLLGFIFVLPLLFGLFISFWAPMMMYFRFLYLIPVMSILLAFAVIPSKEGIQSKISNFKNSNHSLDSRLRGNDKVKYLIISLYLIFSFVYLFIPQFHRENWKGMTARLNPQIPVYMILPSSDPIAYYRSDVSVYELRNIQHLKVPETIYVIPYTSEIYGLNYVDLLQKIGCIKETQSTFRGDVILEKWKCLRNA